LQKIHIFLGGCPNSCWYLLATPPWHWPKDAGRTLRKILIEQRADRVYAGLLGKKIDVIGRSVQTLEPSQQGAGQRAGCKVRTQQ